MPPAPTPQPTSLSIYNAELYIHYIHSFFHYKGQNHFDVTNKGYVEVRDRKSFEGLRTFLKLHDQTLTLRLLQAIIFLAALVAFSGFVLTLAYFIFLCCRAGVACCRKEALCGPNLSRFVLFILLLAMVAMTFSSYIGYSHFIAGVRGVASDVQSLHDTLAILDTNAGVLANQAALLKSESLKLTCNTQNALGNVTMLGTASENLATRTHYYSKALPNPSALTDFLLFFQKQIPRYITYGLGFVSGLAAVSALFGMTGVLFKSSLMLNFSSLVMVRSF